MGDAIPCARGVVGIGGAGEGGGEEGGRDGEEEVEMEGRAGTKASASNRANTVTQCAKMLQVCSMPQAPSTTSHSFMHSLWSLRNTMPLRR